MRRPQSRSAAPQAAKGLLWRPANRIRSKTSLWPFKGEVMAPFHVHVGSVDSKRLFALPLLPAGCPCCRRSVLEGPRPAGEWCCQRPEREWEGGGAARLSGHQGPRGTRLSVVGPRGKPGAVRAGDVSFAPRRTSAPSPPLIAGEQSGGEKVGNALLLHTFEDIAILIRFNLRLRLRLHQGLGYGYGYGVDISPILSCLSLSCRRVGKK